MTVLRKWVLPSKKPEHAALLCSEYHVSPFLADILVARGIYSPAQAEAFLGENGTLSDPFLLPDMDKAVVRVKKAIGSGERIAVYGDYDCDGICASTLLLRYLRGQGANVTRYIPSREGDGYGLNCAAINALFQKGVTLIVTVDNGISAVKEAEYAASLGIDLVITDHHKAGQNLPGAAAVVDAHRPDANCPYRDYSGTGVAYFLVRALCGDGLPEHMADEFAVLAMIGTVGDVVPLEEENRIIVKNGLTAAARVKSDGFKALCEAGGIKGRFNARSVAFGIVPRINAAGRMGNAALAARLLDASDPNAALSLAEELNRLNIKRQSVESEILSSALAVLRERPEILENRVLVLSGEHWDPGVIGIVSARLLAMFGKPTVLFSIDGETATGSARSVDGFPVYDALAECHDLLERYGGHSKAGGLTIRTDNIIAFSEKINRIARERSKGIIREGIPVDRLLSPDEVTVENVNELSILEPFGERNKQPVFLLCNMTILEVLPLSGGKHAKLFLTDGKKTVEAVWFNKPAADLRLLAGICADLLVSLEFNTFRGEKNVSVIVHEMRSSLFSDEEWETGAALFEKVCLGERLSEEELLQAALCRDDIALVYQKLRKIGSYSGDFTMLYNVLYGTGISYIKYRCALGVLRELGLIEYSEVQPYITVKKNPETVDLTASKLFCRLKSLQKLQTANESIS